MNFCLTLKLKGLYNILSFELSENKILISNTRCAYSTFNFNIGWNIIREKFVQVSKYNSLPWLILAFLTQMKTIGRFLLICQFIEFIETNKKPYTDLWSNYSRKEFICIWSVTKYLVICGKTYQNSRVLLIC